MLKKYKDNHLLRKNKGSNNELSYSTAMSRGLYFVISLLLRNNENSKNMITALRENLVTIWKII